jgi:hypothetical protein
MHQVGDQPRFESQVVYMSGNVRDLWSFLRREEGAIRQCLLAIRTVVTPTQSWNTIIISLLIRAFLCKGTSSGLKYVGYKERTRLAHSGSSDSKQLANVNTNLKLSGKFRPSEWNLILCRRSSCFLYFPPLPHINRYFSQPSFHGGTPTIIFHIPRKPSYVNEYRTQSKKSGSW